MKQAVVAQAATGQAAPECFAASTVVEEANCKQQIVTRRRIEGQDLTSFYP
jgi:hypothetical protein